MLIAKNKQRDRYISFSYKDGNMEMIVSRSTIEGLRNAEYIAFIINPEQKLFGITVPEDEGIGIKVSSLLVVDDCYHIPSEQFGQRLQRLCGLSNNEDYWSLGYYSENVNCVFFRLDRLTQMPKGARI